MMKKSDFWKIMGFIQDNCDMSTLRWFEGLGLYYALFHGEVDAYIAAFNYFDDMEEEEDEK